MEMGGSQISMTDLMLWAVVVAVAVTLFSGLIVRRRSLYTEILQDFVKKKQAPEGDEEASDDEVKP